MPGTSHARSSLAGLGVGWVAGVFPALKHGAKLGRAAGAWDFAAGAWHDRAVAVDKDIEPPAPTITLDNNIGKCYYQAL